MICEKAYACGGWTGKADGVGGGGKCCCCGGRGGGLGNCVEDPGIGKCEADMTRACSSRGCVALVGDAGGRSKDGIGGVDEDESEEEDGGSGGGEGNVNGGRVQGCGSIWEDIGADGRDGVHVAATTAATDGRRGGVGGGMGCNGARW